MNYYLVTAKCGHVGNGKYCEVNFPIKAETKREASQICLKKAKVKKQLKDAISQVEEISYEQFRMEKERFNANPYIHAHTKREILDYREGAKELKLKDKNERSSFHSRKERIAFLFKRRKTEEEYAYA